MQIHHLFKKIDIGSLELKNRIIMPPMHTCYSDENGFITQRQIDYYVERARGGVGLIVFEHTGIHQQGKAGKLMTMISDDKYIAGFKKLVDAVHLEGGKISIQINHAGRQAKSAVTGMQIVGPSAVACPVNKEVPHELSIKEIKKIVSLYSEAAERVKKTGADAIEIHMAHGYLLGQFLSPFSNRRNDSYGGNVANRAGLPLEVLAAVRKSVGPDFPISCRISGDEFIEGGLTIDMVKEIAVMFEENGADVIHVSGAIKNQVMNQPNYYHPEGALVNLSAGVKSVVKIPVITVGRIRDLKFADEVIGSGKADLVSMGRALIADPYIVRKALTGKFNDINKCLSCNHCVMSVGKGPLQCAINPETGFEHVRNEMCKTGERKLVHIIGGGLAGLKAAETAAIKGHEVVLFEKNSELGGNMVTASIPPGKEIFLDPLRLLIRKVKNLPVKILLNHEWTVDDSMDQEPDDIIIASGAIPVFPRLEGLDEKVNPTSLDVLKGRIAAGSKVAILGGGSIGAELADLLLSNGMKRDVTVIEMCDDIANDMPKQIQTTLKKRLEEKGVKILTSTKFENCRNQEVIISGPEGPVNLGRFDSIIVSLGLRANNVLAADSLGKADVKVIGDARKARNIREALFEGLKAGLEI